MQVIAYRGIAVVCSFRLSGNVEVSWLGYFGRITQIIVSAYRYIAITNLPIIPVFVEYLGQLLIDFNQIYRHSSVP